MREGEDMREGSLMARARFLSPGRIPKVVPQNWTLSVDRCLADPTGPIPCDQCFRFQISDFASEEAHGELERAIL
jgi:hypothetical protein